GCAATRRGCARCADRRARARDSPGDLARGLVADLVCCLGPDLAAGLVFDLGPDLGPDPARCPARGLDPDLGRRGRAASRQAWIGCVRRSRNSRDDGGGGRRRSRPRTPSAPPQAAWAPSTWVAAPLVLPHKNAREGVE